MEQLRRELVEECDSLSIPISRDNATKLIKYVELLHKWGGHINLVGTRDQRDIVSRHVVDCVAVVPHLPPGVSTLIDVGSGGGLPGAIIAILRPQISVVGLEPVRKKLAFLNSLRREIPLPNFTALPIRVEDLMKSNTLTLFDAAISRATFPLPEWLGVGKKLIGHGGVVLAMEGSQKQPLPVDASRHPYLIKGHIRAVIVCHHS